MNEREKQYNELERALMAAWKAAYSLSRLPGAEDSAEWTKIDSEINRMEIKVRELYEKYE